MENENIVKAREFNQKRQVLKTLDKDLDDLKESIYEQDSLRLEKDDIVILKAINEKFKNIVGLVNYLAKNQHELCTTPSKTS